MFDLRTILLIAVAFCAGGCAGLPPQPVELRPGLLGTGSGTIGIATSALPAVDTSFPGADCLLCLVFAAGANSTLTKHTRTLPYEGLDKLGESVAEALRKKGVNIIVIPEAIAVNKLKKNANSKVVGAAPKDFSPLKAKYNIDKLLVIDLQRIGFVRSYAAYIPTSDPKATIGGISYIVDLSNNMYDWYLPLQITRSAEGAWDEPPQFPGLTNAYFQSVETAKDAVLKTLADN
jgi:hypothetical protein